MIGYYFITDRHLSRAGNLRDVSSALKAGAKFLQYRDKCANAKESYREALKIKAMCKKAVFLVNDRADIALAVNADGIHLGQDDLPVNIARKLLGKKKIIGLTVHSLKQAKAGERLGADYLAAGPVFSTGTKKDAGRPLGPGLIKAIKKHVSIPVVAIGGINFSNAKKIIDAGADGLCAISAVVTKPDVAKEIRNFQALWKK